MPELPEVEAACRLIRSAAVGKRIKLVIASDDEKVFCGSTPEEVRQALEGRVLQQVRRKGKYFWFELDSHGPWPVMHFGMTGAISVQGIKSVQYKRAHVEANAGGPWPPRFCKLELVFEGGNGEGKDIQLAFSDARRFARIKLQADPLSTEPLSKLGPDALDELPAKEQWRELVRKRTARAQTLKAKALLLEQEFVSGIGNWVGDEVLYRARMHPEQAVAGLSDAQLDALHDAIWYVVTTAVDLEADSDRFPRDWLFHYRWTGKKESSINGQRIDFVTVGSRTSAFVPALQKLVGKPATADGDDTGTGTGSKRSTKARAEGNKRSAAGGKAKGKQVKKKRKGTGDSSEDEDEGGSDVDEDNEDEDAVQVISSDDDGDDNATNAAPAKSKARGTVAKATKGTGRSAKGSSKAVGAQQDENASSPSKPPSAVPAAKGKGRSKAAAQPSGTTAASEQGDPTRPAGAGRAEGKGAAGAPAKKRSKASPS